MLRRITSTPPPSEIRELIPMRKSFTRFSTERLVKVITQAKGKLRPAEVEAEERHAGKLRLTAAIGCGNGKGRFHPDK